MKKRVTLKLWVLVSSLKDVSVVCGVMLLRFLVLQQEGM